MQTDLYGVVKRENNKKRSFMVVNRRQAKLVPASPAGAIAFFRELAGKVKGFYSGERLLVIGFAESATAIAAAVAAELDAACIHTTREPLLGPAVCFSEEHSHAAGQQLPAGPLLVELPGTDRILFVEDEVTTGRTIKNCVERLRELAGRDIPFSVASLIDARNEPDREYWDRLGIPFFSLEKIHTENFDALVQGIGSESSSILPEIRANGETGFHPEHNNIFTSSAAGTSGRVVPENVPNNRASVTIMKTSGAADLRGLVQASEYQSACILSAQKTISVLKQQYPYLFRIPSSILVLGTEEFMYPPILLGSLLEQQGFSVECQATSRSPLVPSFQEGYLLRNRYSLPSLYDEKRKTFLYNLEPHDVAIVLTDAPYPSSGSLDVLEEILTETGQERIIYIQWTNTYAPSY